MKTFNIPYSKMIQVTSEDMRIWLEHFRTGPYGKLLTVVQYGRPAGRLDSATEKRLASLPDARFENYITAGGSVMVRDAENDEAPVYTVNSDDLERAAQKLQQEPNLLMALVGTPTPVDIYHFTQLVVLGGIDNPVEGGAVLSFQTTDD